MNPTAAREAFAAGWALVGGPLTERVKNGCRVAVMLATEHAEDPGILETTLILGTLEGTWSQVYDRRGKLFTHHGTAVTRAYRVLMAGLGIDDAVRHFRAALRTTSTDDPAQTVRTAAEVEADRLLHQAVEDPSEPAYIAVVAAIADALLDAEAEGTAGAIAVAALQYGLTRVDFDKAFGDARSHMDADSARSDAQALLGQIIDGNASDLRDLLVRFVETGTSRVKEDDTSDSTDDEDLADEAALIAGVTDFLTGDVRAVDTLLGQAMGRAFTSGVLALLTREGATTVDFITAGTNSCPRCLDIEAGNPWPIGQVPSPPIHPRCECTTTSTSLLPSLDVSSYLIGV